MDTFVKRVHIKMKISKSDSLYLKMERYCHFQERCRFEVLTKWKLEGGAAADAMVVIDMLEESGVLDERRFAISFARGKARISGWGPYKVSFALTQKRVERSIISAAIAENETEFESALQTSMDKKFRALRQSASPTDLAGLRRYLAQKGFDRERIEEALKRR